MKLKTLETNLNPKLKKGRISESLRISEEEKSNNELKISDIENQISKLRKI